MINLTTTISVPVLLLIAYTADAPAQKLVPLYSKKGLVVSTRFHHQWLPDSLVLEKNGFAADVINNLKEKGHNIKIAGILGDVQAILWDGDKQEWSGWSDPRKDGL